MSEQHQEGPRQIWLRNITGSTEVTDSGDPLATEYLRADLAVDRERRMAARIAELEARAVRQYCAIEDMASTIKTIEDAVGATSPMDGSDLVEAVQNLARRDKLAQAQAYSHCMQLLESASDDLREHCGESGQDELYDDMHSTVREIRDRLRREAEGVE